LTATFELTRPAGEDLDAIAIYTIETWSPLQAERYLDDLEACFDAIAARDAIVRVPLPTMPDLVECRCGHHFVYALHRPLRPLLIIAILHESMDLVVRLRERLRAT
jgi:toxin ParE1/3/4